MTGREKETSVVELKLQLLTRDQIKLIHFSSLKILEAVGVIINENSLLNFLAHNGVTVDADEKRAKLPPSLIEECIKKAPTHVTFYARDPKRNISLEEGKIYTHPVGGAANVIDVDSNTMRPSTLKDVEDLTKIVDYLPNIHSQTMIVYPNDIPSPVRDIYAVETIIRNTGKNFDATPFTDESFEYIIRIVETVTGEEELRKKPIITCSASPTSPLQFSNETTKIMMRATKRNLPIAVLPCPLAGATCPDRKSVV